MHTEAAKTSRPRKSSAISDSFLTAEMRTYIPRSFIDITFKLYLVPNCVIDIDCKIQEKWQLLSSELLFLVTN